MKHRINLLLFLLASFSSSVCFSQYYYYNNTYYDKDLLFEVGGGIGGMNALTDLGGSKSNNGFYLNELTPKNTKFNAEFYIAAMYQQTFGLRLQITYGGVQGADSVLKGTQGKSRGRYERNLSFKSTIREVSAVFEFHPLMLKYFEDGPPRLSPYFMAGLGWFSFNPQARLNGQWIDLQPLRTEGQGFKEHKGREPYNLSQVNVPVGFGVKYELSPLFNIRGEFLHRMLFTDYLDDVSIEYIDPALFDKYLSPAKAAQARALYQRNRTPTTIAPGTQRGGPVNDSYMSFNIKVGIVLGREKR